MRSLEVYLGILLLIFNDFSVYFLLSGIYITLNFVYKLYIFVQTVDDLYTF